MFSNLIFIIFWSTLFALLAESMEVLHFFVVDDKIEGPELINIFKKKPREFSVTCIRDESG